MNRFNIDLKQIAFNILMLAIMGILAVFVIALITAFTPAESKTSCLYENLGRKTC